MVRPITFEGWLMVAACLAVLCGVLFGIWGKSALSTAQAVFATALVAAIVVLVFIWIVRTLMTRLPPAP